MRISQRQLVAQYNKMLGEVEETNKGEELYFKCIYEKCDNEVVVEVMDNGKIQEELKCIKCSHKMIVSEGRPDDLEAKMNFYRPELNKLMKKRDKTALINFVLQGGLVLIQKEIEKVKNPLEIALDTLRELPFKKMPTHQEFYDVFTVQLREDLGLLPEKTKIIKLEK